MTQPKPTAQLLLAAETGDPLMAICRYGLGTGLCWTSDLSEKWGSEWLGWGSGAAFWSQIFRGIVRKEQSTGLAATGSVSREQWQIDINRRDEQDRPVNQVKWDSKAIDGNGTEIPVAIRQTGVGRYVASVDLLGHDRINLSLRDTDFSLMKTLGWQRDYPAEYRLDKDPDPAINQLPASIPSNLAKTSNIPKSTKTSPIGSSSPASPHSSPASRHGESNNFNFGFLTPKNEEFNHEFHK